MCCTPRQNFSQFVFLFAQFSNTSTCRSPAVLSVFGLYGRPINLFSKRGDSHPSSPSRSSSAGAVPAKGERRGGGARDLGGGNSGGETRVVALSLPPLGRGGAGGGADARARRKPRHVSTFRERILEERRVRKEVGQNARSRFT